MNDQPATTPPVMPPKTIDATTILQQRKLAEEAVKERLKDAPPAALVGRLPEGCWQIGHRHPGHRGNVSTVIAAIEADASIPEPWRQVIVKEIQTCGACAVEVHAHGMLKTGNTGIVAHIDIRKLF